MSTQRKKRTPPIKRDNYITPIPSTQKKVKKASIVPKSEGKTMGGFRKVRRTEDLLFWDVDLLEMPAPKSASSNKSFKSGDTATTNVDISLKDCESLKHNSGKTLSNKPRKIVKARRHLKQKNLDDEVDDLELHIPAHQIRNMNANINKEVNKSFTPILVQNQKQIASKMESQPPLVSSVERSQRNRRPSNVCIMTESLGNTPVPWKNNKKIKSLKNNISINNISRIVKGADSINEAGLLFSPNKTPENLNRDNLILPVTVTEDVEQTLNTTYDKLHDDDDDIDESSAEKSLSVITIHDSQSFISPSKSGAAATTFFDCSKEQIEPSLTGSVTLSETKRSTFELEQTVNDVSLLQAEAQNDFLKMNKLSNNSQQLKRCSFLNISTSSRLSRVMTPVGVGVSTPFGRSTPAIKASTSKSLREKKPASKVKMPNFAAIHARALQHVENISDYKKRKEDRAQMLLSGKKPLDVSQTKKSETKCKKQIRFAPNTLDKEISLRHIPLPTTPMPINRKNDSITSEQSFIADVNRSKQLLNKLFTSEKYEKENQVLKKDNKLNISKPSATKIVLQEKFFNSSNSSKAKVRVINLPMAFDKAKIIKPVKKEVPKKDFMKKEEIKTIVSSKCSGKQNMDLKTKKRSELAGVRSNRRFDLLMKMRKKGV